MIVQVTDAQSALLELEIQLGDAQINVGNLQNQLNHAYQIRDAIQIEIDALNNYITAVNNLQKVLAESVPVALHPLVQP